MPDEAEILLRFWQEQRDQAKQSEDQRAVMTNIILIISSAGVGLVAKQGVDDRSMILVAVPLIVLGIVGALTSLKYRERFELHIGEARLYRRQLDTLYPSLRLERRWQILRVAHRARHPLLNRVRLYHLWTFIPFVVAITGLGLTIAIAVA